MLKEYSQTILSALIIASILWVGGNVTSQGRQIAVLTVKVVNLQERIFEFHERPSLYREDFSLLITPMVEKSNRLEEDLNRLSERLNIMHDDIYVKYPNPRKVNK